MSDFGKGFVQGISPYIRSSANILSNSIINKADAEKKAKLKADEEAQKQAEKQKYLDITDKLLKGGANAELMNQLPSEYINRYQDIKKETTPAEPKIKVKYDQPNLYQENTVTGERTMTNEKNPYYTPKRTNTVTDYNDKGEKVIRNFYENGTTEDIPTGFYKKGDKTEGFDLDKYNKTLNHFTDAQLKIEKVKTDMLNPDLGTIQKQGLKTQINALNFSNEQTLYNLLDEDSKKIVQEYYDQIKKVGGDNYSELEKTQQDKLKQRFIQKVTENFKGGTEDYAKKRALILWAKFKFGYAN